MSQYIISLPASHDLSAVVDYFAVEYDFKKYLYFNYAYYS